MNRPGQTHDPASPRILIVRVGAMGDVLHGMPAVAALRAALPGAHIAWAVEPRWASLLRAENASIANGAAMPLVDAVHPVETKAWSKRPLSLETLRSVRSLRHALRGERYDIAIDLQGSIRSALIAWGSGASRTVGSAHPRETPASWFYTEQVTPTAPHVVDQAVEIASAAAGLQLQAAQAPLPVDVEAEAWSETLLVGDARPVLFLAPTAGWGAKQWPAERFGELAKRFAATGYRVLVNASPNGTDPVAEQVVRVSGGTASAVACTLPQLVALLRRVQLAVAGDSGPLHLAAALGTAVVALFGPTDPERTGPYGTRSVVLRHSGSRTDHRRHAATEAGLLQIGVDAVLSAALTLLQAQTAPPHG